MIRSGWNSRAILSPRSAIFFSSIICIFQSDSTCGSFGNRHGELLHVHEPVVLGDRLRMRLHRHEMLLDGLADVALGFFDGSAVAEAAGNVGCIGEGPFVFRFFLNQDLKRVELHRYPLCPLCPSQKLWPLPPLCRKSCSLAWRKISAGLPITRRQSSRPTPGHPTSQRRAGLRHPRFRARNRPDGSGWPKFVLDERDASRFPVLGKVFFDLLNCSVNPPALIRPCFFSGGLQ